MFNPVPEYEVVPDITSLKEFTEYEDEYVVRPPYQRKTVWTMQRKQGLLDSLFRRYYIPKLVIREIRLSPNETKKEIIDGQQRINTSIEFFKDKIKLPKTLDNVNSSLPGCYYSDLSVEIRKFIDKEFKFSIDIVKRIEDPRNPIHQKIAAEIFWRLQQGETLTYMEVAHARLSSLARNFVVKYADDISFDYEEYCPLDSNPDKHQFFDLITRNNDRMQHLALLTRFLILEANGGIADIRDKEVLKFIEDKQIKDGIGNLDYENDKSAKSVLRILNKFREIFKTDPIIDGSDDSGIPELSTEYFIVSFFLLLRYLVDVYSLQETQMKAFREFLYDFFDKWKKKSDEYPDILSFSNNRQQSAGEIELRHIILRHLFFKYLKGKKISITPLDSKRSFNEADRISVYRKQEGICKMCLKEGKPEKEAHVSFRKFEADHIIPWSKGGKTETWNAQVLCKHHNKLKSAS